MDAAIVENLGDAPYAADQVAPWTVAAMTRVALAIRHDAPELTLGVNVLRNDARAALGVAEAVDASFIRVNIHTGVLFTDQGRIEGRARDTLLARKALGSDVRIAADVLVKHATPPGPVDLAQVARDTWQRGRADALIVTGPGTGQPTDAAELGVVRAAVPDAPVWVGSGVTPDNARGLRADAAIVGTWLHQNADLRRPLDPERVALLRAALG